MPAFIFLQILVFNIVLVLKYRHQPIAYIWKQNNQKPRPLLICL